MSAEITQTGEGVCLHVNPGICGFTCTVRAQKLQGRMVRIEIEGSQCQQIKRLSELISQIGLRDVFVPFTRNPVFVGAEKSGCHPSCAVPTAVVKAAEAALGLALQSDVVIKFTS